MSLKLKNYHLKSQKTSNADENTTVATPSAIKAIHSHITPDALGNKTGLVNRLSQNTKNKDGGVGNTTNSYIDDYINEFISDSPISKP
jgi:hypothetical protein